MAPLIAEAWFFFPLGKRQETGHAGASISAAPPHAPNIQGVEAQDLSPTYSEAAAPRDPAGLGAPGGAWWLRADNRLVLAETGCQGWGVVGQRSLRGPKDPGSGRR